MADVTITCSECGTDLTISEFALSDSMACRACGAPIERPNIPRAKPRPVIAGRIAKPIANDEEVDIEEQVAVTNRIIATVRPRKRTKRSISQSMIGIAIFILLTIALCFIRFSDQMMGPAEIKEFKAILPWGVTFFHLFMTAKAVRDDGVFFGVMCLFVPGYNIYYLFFQSDVFYLRAVIAAYLVAFGLDTWGVIADITKAAIDFINAWMASGG